MRRKRHVPHNAESDFEVANPDFLSKLWDQLTGALVLLIRHHQRMQFLLEAITL